MAGSSKMCNLKLPFILLCFTDYTNQKKNSVASLSDCMSLRNNENVIKFLP